MRKRIVPIMFYLTYLFCYMDEVRHMSFFLGMGQVGRLRMDVCALVVCALLTHMHMRFMRREITHHYRAKDTHAMRKARRDIARFTSRWEV